MPMHDRIRFSNGRVKETLVLGVSPQYLHIRNLLVPDGRFLDEQDDDAHLKCAVVTQLFARDRFGSDAAAIGQTFEISGIPFTIIGVFKQSVDDFGNSEIEDQTILIPYSVARYFTGTENVKQIYFSMRTQDEVPQAAKEIKRIVTARHRPNSTYNTQIMTEYLTVAKAIMTDLTWLLVAVSAVTLAVGGVGIMNIMLANVRSRIREIGIRKALGATAREIKLQFLAEAVIISLTGGVGGIIVGLAFPLSIRFFTDYNLPISGWSILIALTAATLVGVIFGTVPATRAAQLDPVESLKYE
jgi:putative ABC transport system permease protein